MKYTQKSLTFSRAVPLETITLLFWYSKTTSKLFRGYNKELLKQGQQELGNEFPLLPGQRQGLRQEAGCYSLLQSPSAHFGEV